MTPPAARARIAVRVQELEDRLRQLERDKAMPLLKSTPPAEPTPKPATPSVPLARDGRPLAEVQAAADKIMTGQTAPKCGQPVTGKQGTKPCVKDAGHTGKHSSRVYSTVDTSVISLDDVKVGSFDEGERVTVLTDPGTRSDIQRRVDADVAQAFADWKAHGKPDTLKSALAARFEKIGADGKPVIGADGKPVIETVAKRYWLNPSQEAAWRKLLRAGATLAGVQVRIYPVQKHVSGRYQLPWFAREMRERKSGTKAAEARQVASQQAATK